MILIKDRRTENEMGDCRVQFFSLARTKCKVPVTFRLSKKTAAWDQAAGAGAPYQQINFSRGVKNSEVPTDCVGKPPGSGTINIYR
jgi:hypothetical protein